MDNTDIFTEFSGKTVLIAGTGGLIGSTIVDMIMEANSSLDDKITVVALGRNPAKLSSRFGKYWDDDNFKTIISDVTAIKQVDYRVDYIIHAASPAHPRAYSIAPVDVMKANLLGTMNLLELAKNCNARLLFISSGEIYGISSEKDKAFIETDSGYIDIQNPRACYPESKRASEVLCASYHAQYGTSTVVARLCHVYGPAITAENSRADAQFLRNAINGEDIVMKSKGEQVRSYCYVRDLVTALFYILKWGNSGEAYNIANKNSIASIREYAQTLANAAGVAIKFELPDEIEMKGYTPVSRAVLNASKLEALGWSANYSLAEGLQATVDHLQH